MLLLDFYQRSYSQNPPPVPLQEAHRPAILKLRHRPTSVQDVPTCEPLARTDHEPKAHLYNFQTDFSVLFIFFIHGTINLHWNYHQMLTPINKDRNLCMRMGSCHYSLQLNFTYYKCEVCHVCT